MRREKAKCMYHLSPGKSLEAAKYMLACVSLAKTQCEGPWAIVVILGNQMPPGHNEGVLLWDIEGQFSL